MHKVIKIIDGFAIVGNTEDNTFKRVPLGNCYESIAVEDIVDIFRDGTEYFVMKQEKLVVDQPVSSSKTVIPSINIETVTNQGKKILSQITTTFADIGNTNQSSEGASKSVKNAVSDSEKIDVTWFSNKVKLLSTNFINDLKLKEIWLGATIFLAILFVISFIASIILKDQIVKGLEPVLSQYIGYIDLSGFTINPVFIMGEILFVGFKMTLEGWLGNSITATAEAPLLILSIPVIAFGIFAVKIYHKSSSKQKSEVTLLRKVMTSVLSAIILFTLFSLVFSQDMGGVKLQLELSTTVFKVLFLAIILTMIIVSIPEVKHKSVVSSFVDHALHHYFVIQILGLIFSIFVLLKDGVNAGFLLLGNLTLWFSYALMGGQVDMNIVNLSKQSFLEVMLKGSTNWIWIFIIIVTALMVIDLDDLKNNIKMPDWKLSLIFSGLFTSLLTISAMLPRIALSVKGYDSSLNIQATISSSMYVFIILFVAGFVRLTYLNNIPSIEKTKKIVLQITRFGSKRS